MDSYIFSIGHGHKSKEEFINELNSFGIKYLIDVRSSPYSKWAPHFNKDDIKQFLSQNNIVYVYMGDSIGGRPLDSSCYDEEGKFDYKKMALKPSFQNGLMRLSEANKKQISVAIMCSESDPSQCHRSKLIGRELYVKYDIDMKHIIAPGKIIDECQIIIDLTKGSWDPNGSLFGKEDPPYFKSRKSYKENNEVESEVYYD